MNPRKAMAMRARLRIPKRFRTHDGRQKAHGQPSRWAPSWTREAMRGDIDMVFLWAYGRTCRRAPLPHPLPCACTQKAGGIVDLIPEASALWRVLPR